MIVGEVAAEDPDTHGVEWLNYSDRMEVRPMPLRRSLTNLKREISDKNRWNHGDGPGAGPPEGGTKCRKATSRTARSLQTPPYGRNSTPKFAKTFDPHTKFRDH